MKIISSYGIQVVGRVNFKDTTKIYRSALSFVVDVVNKEWGFIQQIKHPHAKQIAVEKLIHSTKDRSAKYLFDFRFPKFPSYLRRAVCSEAIGIVSSYRSNLENWKANPVGKEPRLPLGHNAYPTFYDKNMFMETDDPTVIQLKLYQRNDWIWVSVKLRGTDVKYLRKYWTHVKPCAPVLEKRYGKYYLRFAFKETVELVDAPVEERRICAVDLGLNSDAVCSIMKADGTVVARKFINFPTEKDHLSHVLNRIKRQQREQGSHSVRNFWHYATRLNDELAKKIAAAITEFAVLYSVHTIVFEYLDLKGKKRDSKRQKLHLWKKNAIQDYVTHKAHRCGIHISHICAWGTSKYAYDGSGTLKRDEKNHAKATFQSGKQYNCDLSASYNIGARYFIRELLKPLPERERSHLQAKVPGSERRTLCTWITLRHLAAATQLNVA